MKIKAGFKFVCPGRAINFGDGKGWSSDWVYSIKQINRTHGAVYYGINDGTGKWDWVQPMDRFLADIESGKKVAA